MPATVIQFPNRSNPTADDIVLLMRTAIKKYYESAINNARDCDIILSVRDNADEDHIPRKANKRDNSRRVPYIQPR
jgi:hypothetical protein